LYHKRLCFSNTIIEGGTNILFVDLVLTYQVSNVRYDIHNASIHIQPPKTLIKLTIENQGAIPQVFRQKKAVSVSRTSSYSFIRGVKVRARHYLLGSFHFRLYLLF
jgi:hypothetical protein